MNSVETEKIEPYLMIRFSGRIMFLIYIQNNSIKKIIVSLHFRSGLSITEIADKQNASE